MSYAGIQLKHLAFLGPDKAPAVLEFKPGLNVVCGASDTGKSFLVSAIDFMTGANSTLEDIPERVGYDRIRLGIVAVDGTEYTLERSVEGGGFRKFSGLVVDSDPPEDFEEIFEKHNAKRIDNVSRFLLGLIGLGGKNLRKNKKGETVSLSFRNLARLTIVQEQDITKKGSPFESGQYTDRTTDYSAFKLLLTGVDDSALVKSRAVEKRNADAAVKAQIYDSLINDFSVILRDLTDDPKGLRDQKVRLESALAQQKERLAMTEKEFNGLAKERAENRRSLSKMQGRLEEISGLTERFTLLRKHYLNDLRRLEAVKESGTLFAFLEARDCPLCGARPERQEHNASCDGNVENVVEAANAEIEKIHTLSRGLEQTLKELEEERNKIDRNILSMVDKLAAVEAEIEKRIAPELEGVRETFLDLAEKHATVLRALDMFERVEELEMRRAELHDTTDDGNNSDEKSLSHIPKSVLGQFAEKVEETLVAWGFPGAERVYFDETVRDLVIGGKPRGSRGKGLRAITHAAFTYGLMDYCRSHDRAHPGFIVLDSPLLAYYEPEGDEEDEKLLAGSDLKERFYQFLSRVPKNEQVIVVENEHPPELQDGSIKLTVFSKNPMSGRYGLFPIE